MAICYYGDRISENMAQTPEGFLVCKCVPIARTGYQTYLSDELYCDGDTETRVDVYRPPEEVFARETLASFEGKPVTNNHPFEDVTADNFKRYALGHVQNVRKGAGNDGDKIVADLYITDPGLIRLIRNGKRQISAGYCAVDKKDNRGRVMQTRIRGNHVAVVDEGRAGRSVSIRDSKHRKGDFNMEKRKGIARVLARYIRDASPEELQDRVEDVVDALAEENAADVVDECNAQKADEAPADEVKDEAPADEVKDEAPELCKDEAGDVSERVASLSEKLDRLCELIEALADRLKVDAAPAVDTQDEAPKYCNDSEIVDADENSDDSSKANDAAIRAISREVLKIKDPAERRRVQDAIIRATSTGKSQMSGLVEATKKERERRDAACKNINVVSMQQAYDALNPHKSNNQ